MKREKVLAVLIRVRKALSRSERSSRSLKVSIMTLIRKLNDRREKK